MKNDKGGGNKEKEKKGKRQSNEKGKGKSDFQGKPEVKVAATQTLGRSPRLTGGEASGRVAKAGWGARDTHGGLAGPPRSAAGSVRVGGGPACP